MCYFTGTGNKTQVKRDTRPAFRNVHVKGDGTTPNTVVGRRPQSPPAHGRSREHISVMRTTGVLPAVRGVKVVVVVVVVGWG